MGESLVLHGRKNTVRLVEYKIDVFLYAGFAPLNFNAVFVGVAYYEPRVFDDTAGYGNEPLSYKGLYF